MAFLTYCARTGVRTLGMPEVLGLGAATGKPNFSLEVVLIRLLTAVFQTLICRAACASTISREKYFKLFRVRIDSLTPVSSFRVILMP